MNKTSRLLLMGLCMTSCPFVAYSREATGSEIKVACSASAELRSLPSRQQAERFIRPKTNVLNVRAAADKGSYTIGTIVKEKEYALLRDNGDWLLIRIAPTKTGWVLAQAVEVLEHKIETAPAAEISAPAQTQALDQTALPRQAFIELDFVNLRAAPDKASHAIGVMEKNEAVTLLQRTEGWYLVQSGDKKGWLPFVAVEAPASTPSSAISPTPPSSRSNAIYLSLVKWGAAGASVLCSAGAAFYYLRGNKTFTEYKAANTPSGAADLYQKTLRYDKKRNRMYWAAGASAATTMALQFLHWNLSSGQKTTVNVSPDPKPYFGALISIHF